MLRRRAPPGSTTSAPASRSPSRSARRSASDPEPAAGRARQARPRRLGRHRRGGLPADDRGDQPGRPSSSTSARAGGPRFGGPAAGAASTPTRGERCCARSCPRCAARSRSERAKVLLDRHLAGGAASSSTRRRPRSSTRSAPPAPTTSSTPSACRCGSRSTRDSDDAETLASGFATLAAEYRDDYERYVERHADADDGIPATRIARVVLIQNLGLVAVGADAAGGAHLARPLPPRDRGDGGRQRPRRVRLADRGARASRSSTGRSSSTSSRWPRRRANCRARSRSSPAPPAGSAARSSTLWRRGRVRRRASTSTARAPRDAVGQLGDRGARRRRRRDDGGLGGRGASRGRGRRVRRRRHRRLQRRHRLERADRGDDAGRVGAQPVGSSPPATSSSRARRSALLRAQGARRLDRVRRLQERARRRPQRLGLLDGQGGRAAPRALPGRGGRRRWHPRQHGQPRRGAAAVRGSGTPSWRAERADAYGIEPDELEEHYRRRTTLRRQHRSRRTSPQAVLHFASQRARARAPATCSTSTAASPRRSRADRARSRCSSPA